jgi:hypothetical protein
LFNRRFGVPLGFERMTPAVALLLIQLATVAEDGGLVERADARHMRRGHRRAADRPRAV